MSNATLVVHAGGTRRRREELDGLLTPEATKSWKPVPHRELVAELIGGLEEQGIRVIRDEYATMGRDDARLFGVMDLAVPTHEDPDFGLALGLQGSNDKSMAIKVIAAARVFVCDNTAFSGSGGSVCLQKKHTTGLDLGREVPACVEAFLEKAGAFRLDLGAMREVGLTDDSAKGLIHDAFARDPVLPVRLFPEVSRLYFADEAQRAMFPDRTLWSINQAFTQAVKVLRPGSAHKGGQKIGRFFGRTLRNIIGSAAERN